MYEYIKSLVSRVRPLLYRSDRLLQACECGEGVPCRSRSQPGGQVGAYGRRQTVRYCDIHGILFVCEIPPARIERSLYQEYMLPISLPVLNTEQASLHPLRP